MVTRRFESDRRYNGLAFAFFAYQPVLVVYFLLLYSVGDPEDPRYSRFFETLDGLALAFLGLAIAMLPLILKRSRAGAIAAIVYAGLILLYLGNWMIGVVLSPSALNFIGYITVGILGSGPAAILGCALRALPAAEPLGDPSIVLAVTSFAGLMTFLTGAMILVMRATS